MAKPEPDAGDVDEAEETVCGFVVLDAAARLKSDALAIDGKPIFLESISLP